MQAQKSPPLIPGTGQHLKEMAIKLAKPKAMARKVA